MKQTSGSFEKNILFLHLCPAFATCSGSRQLLFCLSVLSLAGWGVSKVRMPIAH